MKKYLLLTFLLYKIKMKNNEEIYEDFLNFIKFEYSAK